MLTNEIICKKRVIKRLRTHCSQIVDQNLEIYDAHSNISNRIEINTFRKRNQRASNSS